VASTLIGVLPTIHTAGIVAPILLILLRAMQGIAAGGEWSAATSMVVESAPVDKRARYASYIQMGSPIGTLLSTGAVALGVGLLGNDGFVNGGWRIPYLATIVFAGIGLWLRFRMEESHAFEMRQEAKVEAKGSPVIEVFRTVPGRWLLAVFAYVYCNAGFFIVTTYMISYVTITQGKDNAGIILNALTIGAGVQLVMVFLTGRVADRFGAGPTTTFGYIVTVLCAYPVFLLVDTGKQVWMIVAMILALGLSTIAYASIGALLKEYFPGSVSVSAMALATNTAGLIAGFMPMLATFVFGAFGRSVWGPSTLLFSIALISTIATIIVSRTVAREKAQGIDMNLR